ncbi:hypothetical protein ACWGPP_06180 [Agromyces sp. NPDC055657]
MLITRIDTVTRATPDHADKVRALELQEAWQHDGIGCHLGWTVTAIGARSRSSLL